MKNKKLETIFNYVFTGLIIVFMCIASAFMLDYVYSRNNYVTQEELNYIFDDLEEDLIDEFEEVEYDLDRLENELDKSDQIIVYEQVGRLRKELYIYQEVLGEQHRYINGEITLEEYNERLEYWNERYQEIK